MEFSISMSKVMNTNKNTIFSLLSSPLPTPNSPTKQALVKLQKMGVGPTSRGVRMRIGCVKKQQEIRPCLEVGVELERKLEEIEKEEGSSTVELLECLEREAIMGNDEGREPIDYNRRALIFDKSSKVFQALKQVQTQTEP